MTEKEEEFSSLSHARDEVGRRLFMDPGEGAFAAADEGPAGFGNVVGVGSGEKEVNAVLLGQLAVKVFVKEKHLHAR